MKFEEYVYSNGVNKSHRHVIEDDDVVGCYSCCTTFQGHEIEEWINEQRFGGPGETAVCPLCGIDAVVKVDTILQELSRRQFGYAPDDIPEIE
jgi:hypothetical protein